MSRLFLYGCPFTVMLIGLTKIRGSKYKAPYESRFRLFLYCIAVLDRFRRAL